MLAFHIYCFGIFNESFIQVSDCCLPTMLLTTYMLLPFFTFLWLANNLQYYADNDFSINLAGSPSGNNLTPAGPCRYDSSLGITAFAHAFISSLSIIKVFI